MITNNIHFHDIIRPKISVNIRFLELPEEILSDSEKIHHLNMPIYSLIPLNLSFIVSYRPLLSIHIFCNIQ